MKSGNSRHRIIHESCSYNSFSFTIDNNNRCFCIILTKSTSRVFYKIIFTPKDINKKRIQKNEMRNLKTIKKFPCPRNKRPKFHHGLSQIIARLIITIEKGENKWIFADQKPNPKKSAYHCRKKKENPHFITSAQPNQFQLLNLMLTKRRMKIRDRKGDCSEDHEHEL